MKWIWISVLCSVIPLVFLASMFFMPESPRYYIMQGKRAEAAESLRKLRGGKSASDVEPELEAVSIYSSNMT
jgi:hypothetical protein